MNIRRKEPCDIPCEYISNRADADASVYERRGYIPPHAGDKFSIYLQMEGEHYYPINLEKYHLENSYRWNSSPLLKPYFEFVHYHDVLNISNPRVGADAIDGASFIAKNCGAQNNRHQVVRELREAGIRVDGLSGCLRTPANELPTIPQIANRRAPWMETKLDLMRPYKFHLAFENGNVEDYVTEKVYTALAAGTLPIYLGAPNIRDFVPDHSIVDVTNDFGGNIPTSGQSKLL